MISLPWTVIAAAATTFGMKGIISNAGKKVLEEKLVEHPDVHKFSPNLKKMVTELYQKTGLSSKTYPVYGFKTQNVDDDKDGCLVAGFSKVFNMMAQTPNAAASHIGKPVIMISEPALQIMNDAEEYAVLAHEFAHIGAHHNFIGKMHSFIGSIARSSNAFLRVSEAVAAGWKGILSSCALVFSTQAYYKKIHSNADLLEKDKKLQTIGEFQLKKEMELNKSYISQIGFTLALTAFNPNYFGIYVATKALNEATILVEKRLSRSKEYQADAGSIKLGANPLALITALRKITKLYEHSLVNEYGFDPRATKVEDPLTRYYNKQKLTHPELKERFSAIAEIAKDKGYSSAEIDHAIHGKITIPEFVEDVPSEVLELLMQKL